MAVIVNTRSLISRTNCMRRVVSTLASVQQRDYNSALSSPYRALDVNKSGSTKTYHTRLSYRSYSSGLKQKPVLTLFTNDDCTLCDEAMKELSPYLDQASQVSYACYIIIRCIHILLSYLSPPMNL